jgi:hypothetical protein
MLQAISEELETPYGVMMLAPAFTRMREDVGRVTQKFPGSAENGSIYNHTAAFYVHSLYHVGESDRAFRCLRQMLPGPDLVGLRTPRPTSGLYPQLLPRRILPTPADCGSFEPVI